MGLVTDASTVRVMLRSTAEPLPESGAFSVGDEESQWIPATDIFDFKSQTLLDGSVYLTFYKSSPQRTRWFCSRCGTPIGYTIDKGVIPEEWGWPIMLDLWLGTVDREILEQDYLMPERMLWCEKGIAWVRKLSREGLGVPEHPLTSK